LTKEDSLAEILKRLSWRVPKTTDVMKRILTIACLLIVVQAFSQSGRSLLALSKADHTLSIVDPVTLKITAKIPVGQDPHELTASTDGRTAYVCIYGGGSLHEINVIDLVNNKPLKTIDTRPLYGPHDIVFVNGKAWFTAEGSKAIGRYDPQTDRIDWSMGTGQDRTHMIHVSEDAKRIYTTNINSGTVSILDDSTSGAAPNARSRQDWIHTVLPTAKGSEGFDVLANANELWTASSNTGNITVIDLVSKKSKTTIDAKVQGANRLKFTPDGKQAFITSLQTGELTVIDTRTHQEIKRIKLGKGAAGILMDPVGQRAFVACSPDNYIAVINLKTLTVTGKLEVGGTPDGLAWASRQ
jgi:YVTN family beta-propeller protein